MNTGAGTKAKAKAKANSKAKTNAKVAPKPAAKKAVNKNRRVPVLSDQRQRGLGVTSCFSAWVSVAGALFAYAVGGSSQWSF